MTPSLAKYSIEEAFRISLRLYPDFVLRQVSIPVERFDSSLRDLVSEMRSLMRICSGLGLAAPQAGISQQLFVAEVEGRALCLANPRIINSSGHDERPEGCLSLPGFPYLVARHRRLLITGFDERGRRKKLALTGLWARLAQHETDHLNGILICDHGRILEPGCQGCPLLGDLSPETARLKRKAAS
jgi:peptide deformylase